MRRLAVIERRGLHQRNGHLSAASWLATSFRVGWGSAKEQVRVARALEEMPKRLGQDHANARFLAERLTRLPGIDIDPVKVCTNIVIFSIARTGLAFAELSARLKSRGVLVSPTPNPSCVRMVTHLNVSRGDCERAVEAVAEAIA